MISKVLGYAVLFILLAIAGWFLYLQISDLTAKPVDLVLNKTYLESQPSYTGELQFKQNMRYTNKDIGYNIDTACDEVKKTKVNDAFDYLENATNLLNFFESENAKIFIICSPEKYKKTEENSYIPGEGEPWFFYNGYFNIIQNGTVLLFKTNPCDNYNVELHEILHILGFNHSINKMSIMYPILENNCNQVVTNDIILELIRLYSIPSLPDLYFSDSSVRKQGSLIDFNVSIGNRGLVDINNSEIIILADNKKIYDYSLGSIGNNEQRFLEGTNIRSGRGITQITFSLIDGQEIDYNNNNISLYLPSSD